MPLIDIVMPVKNGARFLPEALDSLASQTLQDFRLLVCDDGSTDETCDILRRETRFPVVIVRHEQSRGVANSLNELLRLPSESRFVARLDSDDVCHPERLKRQAAFLHNTPRIGVVGCQLEIIDETGATIGYRNYPTDPDGIRLELLFTNPLAHPAVMVRSELLRADPSPYRSEFSVTEDYDLWCRLSATAEMANLPEAFVRYRRHGQAVGVAHLTEQRAQMDAIRREFASATGLSSASRDLLLSTLGLSDSLVVPTSRSARQVLRELDSLFSTKRSTHANRRRAELALTLMRNLSHGERLRLFLSDHRTALAYVERKWILTTSRWRRRYVNSRAATAQKRFAARLRREIKRGGGTCEADLRIYGDAFDVSRIRLNSPIVIEHGCSFWISPPEYRARGRLDAGANLFLGFNCRINVFEDVIIGENVSVGANTYITSNNHNYLSAGATIQSQGFNGAPVIISDDVWIGCNTVVLPGVSIGRGAVIGAGSVVTRDVPPFEVWAGVPARRIKVRSGAPVDQNPSH